MVEAAVRGIVDFSQTKFFDAAWRRRVRFLISGLQDLNHREELKINRDYYLGLLSLTQRAPTLIHDLFQGLDAATAGLASAYRPWITPESQAEARRSSGRKFQEAWEQYHGGKLDDPQMQQRIQRTAEALRRSRERNAASISPDDILTDPKKRAAARAQTGQTRRSRNNGRLRSTLAGPRLRHRP